METVNVCRDVERGGSKLSFILRAGEREEKIKS
jgi:hypothetical protein